MGTLKISLLLSLIGMVMCGERQRDDIYLTLYLDWAMSWGTWGPEDFCPSGSFAYAFEIKVESEEAADDTSMNAIRLYCKNLAYLGKDSNPHTKDTREYYVTSTEQVWGDWKGRRDCGSGLLTGLRMKSEEDQGNFVDDTAANDLEMQCDYGLETHYGGGNHWGYWSTWESCPEGWALCGLQTRVEEQSAADDTALNDVRMFCCPLPALKHA